VIGGILANLIRNQFKIIINTRVVMDRDNFNYEQYMSKGFNDNKMLHSTLFMKDGKKLVTEFLQFQAPQPKSILNLF
jgi:hypothetical protein